MLEQLVITPLARVVLAVGNHQQRFLIELSFFHVIHRKVDRIKERGFQAWIQAVESVDDVPEAAGKVLLEISNILKRDDEGLIVGIAFFYERKRGAVNLLLLTTHAAAVINDQPDADRDVFMFEEGDLLRNVVFEDLEILFG